MKTTSICPHVNCLVNHNGNPCNCNMAQYCSQCKKENPIPPSAQTEWERTLLQRLKNKMMRISHLSGQNYGQENWESIVKGGALDIWMFIKEIVASERTRLLSVESMFNAKEIDTKWIENFYEGGWKLDSLKDVTDFEKSIIEELGTFLPRHMEYYDWNLPYAYAIVLIIRNLLVGKKIITGERQSILSEMEKGK